MSKQWEFSVLRYKVIDANTVRAVMDVGFHTTVERNLSLVGLDHLPSKYVGAERAGESEEIRFGAAAITDAALSEQADIVAHVRKRAGGFDDFEAVLFGRKTTRDPYVHLNDVIRARYAAKFPEAADGSS